MHTEQSPPASSTAPDPQTGLGWGLLLTALAWLTCRLVVGARWAPARNPIRFDPSLWARWDTFNYGAITQYGRGFGACNSTAFAGLSNPFHATWCGTAAWLPGYPWLIRGLQTTGISLPDAGLMISWAAMAIALFVVWLGWARSLHPVRALFVMVAFGVFPGAVYNFALFPTSVALAGVVGAILAATRERFLVAAVLMTVAGLSYPSAWFAAGGLAAGMILVGCSLGARQVVRRGLWGIAGLASLIVLGVHDQIVFGHANAYVLVHTGHGLDTHGLLGESWIRLVVQRDTAEQRRIGTSAADALAVQGLLAVVMMAVATARTGWTWVETRVVDDVYPAAVGLAVVVSVLLISATGGAWNRSVVLAAPCVICLRRLPFPLLALLVVISAVTTAFVSRAFFAGTLV